MGTYVAAPPPCGDFLVKMILKFSALANSFVNLPGNLTDLLLVLMLLLSVFPEVFHRCWAVERLFVLGTQTNNNPRLSLW